MLHVNGFDVNVYVNSDNFGYDIYNKDGDLESAAFTEGNCDDIASLFKESINMTHCLKCDFANNIDKCESCQYA